MSCQCRACGRDFGGITAFDRHRVGKYTRKGPDYGRRCLTEEEMLAAGLWITSRGTWGGETPPETAFAGYGIAKSADLSPDPYVDDPSTKTEAL